MFESGNNTPRNSEFYCAGDARCGRTDCPHGGASIDVSGPPIGSQEIRLPNQDGHDDDWPNAAMAIIQAQRAAIAKAECQIERLQRGNTIEGDFITKHEEELRAAMTSAVTERNTEIKRARTAEARLAKARAALEEAATTLQDYGMPNAASRARSALVNIRDADLRTLFCRCGHRRGQHGIVCDRCDCGGFTQAEIEP